MILCERKGKRMGDGGVDIVSSGLARLARRTVQCIIIG